MRIAVGFLNTGVNLVLFAPVDNFSFQKSNVVDLYWEICVG